MAKERLIKFRETQKGKVRSNEHAFIDEDLVLLKVGKTKTGPTVKRPV
jgi:hypothetical protein